MIHYLTREQINDEKYNDCINHSLQNRIYAYSWYLDCVCDRWSLLVLDDYQVVMPLPWKRKYGLQIISQPFFTQQLGLFSVDELKEGDFLNFVKAIPKKFVKIALNCNSLNVFKKEEHTTKVNFTLSLNSDYKTLYSNYSKGRKHALGAGLKNNLKIESVEFSELLALGRGHYEYTELKEKDFQKLSKLISILKDKCELQILGVYDQEQLIGGSVFVIHSNHIIYLFSAMHPKGKKKQVPTILLDQIIKKFSGQEFVLDFEGSMIPSIASFFKSFGAQREAYFLLKKSLL